MPKIVDVTKDEARIIWECRCEHDGYCEDSEEYCDALRLDPDKVYTFHCWVSKMIEEQL